MTSTDRTALGFCLKVLMEWLPFAYSLLVPGYDLTASVFSFGVIPHAQRTLSHAIPEVQNLLSVGGGPGACLRLLLVSREFAWGALSNSSDSDFAPGLECSRVCSLIR